MRAGAVVRCSVLGRWAVLLELVQFLGAGPLFVSWIAAHAGPVRFAKIWLLLMLILICCETKIMFVR